MPALTPVPANRQATGGQAQQQATSSPQPLQDDHRAQAAAQLRLQSLVAVSPPAIRTASLQNMLDHSAQAGQTRTVQRMMIKGLPHPRRSVDDARDIDTDGRDAHYLLGWADMAAETNRPALLAFINLLDNRPQLSRNDMRLLHNAIIAWERPIKSVIREDENGDTVAAVGEALVDAQRVDYGSSKSYLTEGEGAVLAQAWQVDATVYDQPQPGERFIRRVIRYGEGQPRQGLLLFVNGNHYVVIEPDGAGEYQDHAGNPFKSVGLHTAIDGNCLIDGLHILRHHRNATADELLTARRLIAGRISSDSIRQLITANIADYLAGIRPMQLGPEVRTILDQDRQLAARYRQARRLREQRDARQSAVAGKGGEEAGEPVLALPGISYLGPSKEEDGETIHRGEAELEKIGEDYYVRMYAAVAAPAVFTAEDPELGEGTAPHKDIQQDAKSGRIVIATGANSMMWISGGRILRQLKWAEKYIVEHRAKAAAARAEAAILQGQYDQASDQTEPYDLDGLQEAIDDKLALAKFHDSIKSPLIRSFLIPLSEFNDISRRAISESLITKEGNKTKTFNVDRHAEPNQFGVRGDDLGLLRRKARPGSLVTYAYDAQALEDDKRSGEVRDVGLLRERLGIPRQEIANNSVWTQGGTFIDRDRLEPEANKLNMHYVTWLQSLSGASSPDGHALLNKEMAVRPYEVRRKLLAGFLAEHNIEGAQAIREFMETMVAPWATQAMIENTMGEDYEQASNDENVKSAEESTFKTNAFAESLAAKDATRELVAQVGDQLTEAVGAKDAPQQMVDILIAMLPELKDYFIKISAKNENYEFYEHAQMVLG